MSDSTSISPTAHYTGQVWTRNGLSSPAFSTWQGRLMHAGLEPAMKLSRLAGGPSLEPYLVARHRAIDALLEQSIAEDGVTQVLEVAAGMSARGSRFHQRHGEAVEYVEADLPAMAARKRIALERAGSLGSGLRVEDVDALRAGGPSSLESIAGGLDPERGLVIVTEGLTSYLSTGALVGLWERCATILASFSSGRYLADVMPRSAGSNPLVRGGRIALSAFVRGKVHFHFADEREVEEALRQSGFAEASVRPAHEIVAAGGTPASLGMARIADARTG